MAREFEKRDKKAHKMTKDGLVEKNLATGEEQRVSQRGQDFNLRQPDRGAAGGQPLSVRETLSHARTHNTYKQQEPPSETAAGFRQTDPERRDDTPIRTDGAAPDSHYQHPMEAPAHDARGPSPYDGGAPQDKRSHSQRDSAYRFSQEAARPEQNAASHAYEPQRPDPARPEEAFPRHDAPKPAQPDGGIYEGGPADGERNMDGRTLDAGRPGRLRFDDTSQTPSSAKPRQKGTAYHSKFAGHVARPEEPVDPATSEAPRSDVPDASRPPSGPASHRDGDGTPHGADRKRPAAERPGRLRFDDTGQATTTDKKPKQNTTAYQRRFVKDADGSPEPDRTGASDSDGAPQKDGRSTDGSRPDRADADSAPPRKKSKLEYTKDETPPDAAKPGRKLEKAAHKAEQSAAKLEKAQRKLPTRRRVRLNKEFDAEAGKPKRKLRFEKEVKTQRQHLKGPLLLRPVKFGANAGIGYIHKKIHQVENENVGVEAAHKGALVVEGALRKGYRMHKTRPYRRVAKLQRKATKRAVKLTYQQALADNPKLRSNLISRMMQKQKIKRQYAKAAREAKRAGKAAKKAGDALSTAAKAVVGFIRRHPVVFGILALILLLMFLIMGFFSSCSNMATGGLSSIVASSYLAEDADIDNAELSYTEWETDLQLEIANAESTHSGYDEYRYNVDDIGHNPYELMAFLTSVYQDYSYSEIQAVLREIFAEQYTLSFVEEVEVRYRTETHTDSEGNSYDVEVPYNWYILNINLTARSFSDVIAPRIDSNQREIYDLLMLTKGNRQYLFNPFDFNWLPYVSSYYGWRIHPTTAAKDYHKGIDIAVPTGTEILAGHDGVVTSAGNAGDYGLVVVLDDGEGLVSKYAHCSELLVSVGQEVKKGDVIAKVGSTGNSTGPHLHLEIIKNGQYLNPLYFALTGDDGSGSVPPGQPGGPVIPEYPGAPMGDGSFAAMMEEAQKHLGKRYVFGASGPDTFDCSGFVSYVINHSGVGSVGRKSAQGLYNITTPVSRENAQPGDLIFFHSTYSTSSTVTHVGIYIGNGQMIHAGKPIQYASIDTNYWTDHFYAFGRL